MKKTSRFKYIGIDPGKGGGVAMINEKGIMKAYKCPDSSEEMALLFQILIGSTPAAKVRLLMERVWARPTNAVRAAFSYGVQMNTAMPVEWIKWVGCPKALKRDVRKRWLKKKAGDLYPKINKLTLATSDAILITHYAKEEYFNER